MLNNQEPSYDNTSSTELIPITRTNDGTTAVMGRDIHAFLESKEPYTVWIKRMIGYGFTEGADYVYKNLKIERPAPLPQPRRKTISSP